MITVFISLNKCNFVVVEHLSLCGSVQLSREETEYVLLNQEEELFAEVLIARRELAFPLI